MTQIDTQYSNTIYLILDGSKTIDKTSFLVQISELLKFPDYFGHNWDALNDCLNHPQDWGVDVTHLSNVIILWLDPINFSMYNSADFWTAIDILKSVTEDKTNSLTFVLAGNVSNINTALYK